MLSKRKNKNKSAKIWQLYDLFSDIEISYGDVIAASAARLLPFWW